MLEDPNHSHSAITREQFHILTPDLDNIPGILDRVKPDVVFHLASLFLSGHTPDDLDGLVNSNILFGTKLVEAMTQNGCLKLVNTGTSWQHFGNCDYSPVNLYAATKQAFENILEFYVQARGLKVVTLKLFDTYGPGDRRRKLMPVLLEKFLKHEPIPLTAGENMLDLVYVDDVCRAFSAAAKRLTDGSVRSHEVFFVRSGDPVTLRCLLETFSRVGERDIHAEWGAFPYRDREVMVPVKGGETIPGWEPSVPLEEGIRRYIDSASGVAK